MNRARLIRTISSLFKLLLGSPQILCAGFLVLLALPAVFYTAHTLNLSHLEGQTIQNTNTVSQDIRERIGVINTVLASMVGLHDVTSDLDNEKLLRFSNDILRNADYIKNLGRYKRIDHENRGAFESVMSHNGYSDFSIAQITDDGRFEARPDQHTYYPVSLAGPLHATIPGLLGTDFGALPGFADALENVEGSDQSTIIALPNVWPLKGDLIALRPVPPENGNGGFWITLDIKQMFDGLSDVANEFDVSIMVVNAEKQTSVYSKLGIHDKPLFLDGLYSRKTIDEVWEVSPSTMLVISFEQAVGVSLSVLASACAAALLVTLASCLYTTHIINLRRNERERKQGEQNLFEERAKAEKTLNSVQDAIITLDPDMNIVHINPAAVIQFNTMADYAIGKPLASLTQFHRVNESSTILSVELELSALTHAGKKEIDVVPAGYCDEDFVLRMSLSSSHDHEGCVSGHVIVLRDISQERRLTRKLAYQANYDALTGCTNRYFFEQSLDQLVAEMPTSGMTHTLCYLDLDQFKIVNDTCGHRAGDQLLIELTKNMQLMIRDNDILSRLGGDEFGVILVGVSKEKATSVAQRIYQFFQNYVFVHQGNSFSVTASIGVVHIDTLCANSKDIMASADIACYAAKDSGRNSMSVYSKSDEGMAERSEELHWLPRLQTALQNNEFRLHAQAVAALHSEQAIPPITHFEFLLRLADKDGGEVTPWQFIQAAERYDLMRDIDRWVIRNALQTVSRYSVGDASHCSFSINLSGQSAADPTLKSFIQQQFLEHQVDPTKIWFELTETAAISHFSVAVDLIKNIRSTGAKVALDDFGSGLSSFGYLKNLPVDVIKIDGQFVKEIVRNPIDREMVRAIHRVGESMQIETVAEFVEDQATVDELKRIGVNYAQGYHIGRPEPVGTALEAVSKPQRAA